MNAIVCIMFYLSSIDWTKIAHSHVLSLSYRCTEGFMGQRCEYKDLDGSYLRKLTFTLTTFDGFPNDFPFFYPRV